MNRYHETFTAASLTAVFAWLIFVTNGWIILATVAAISAWFGTKVAGSFLVWFEETNRKLTRSATALTPSDH